MKKREILRSVMAADARKIRETCEKLDPQAFEEAVAVIRKARNRYIMGMGKSAVLASYFYSQLRLVFDNVRLVSEEHMRGLLEQLFYINEKDVVVAIDFPPYSVEEVKLLEFASRRKAKIVTVTDDVLSPVNLYASCKLTAVCDRTAIGDSLVAPMSLLNMLVASVSMNRRKKVLAHLETLESICEDYHLSHSSDDAAQEEIEIWGMDGRELRQRFQKRQGEKHE